VALLLGWAVLGESIGVTTLTGAALIGAGVAGVLYGQQLITVCLALRSLRFSPPGRPRVALVVLRGVRR
jgi:hypothetical protein